MRTHQTAAIAAALLLGISSFAMAAERSTTGNTTGTTTAPSTATGMAPGRSTSGPGTSANAGARSGTSSAMMSEAQVKQKLEKEGYTNVTGLKEAKNGAWKGKAMHNGKQVTVTVDQTGQVTTM